ncbi:MAG: hypothetical protein AAF909_08775 [Pseudomonadota bacterium]
MSSRRTRTRSSTPPAGARISVPEPTVSLDEVGVGAISDLTAIGGVAAAFSSDLGAGARETPRARDEGAALNAIKVAPPKAPVSKSSQAKSSEAKSSEAKKGSEASGGSEKGPAKARKTAAAKKAASPSAKRAADASAAKPTQKPEQRTLAKSAAKTAAKSARQSASKARQTTPAEPAAKSTPKSTLKKPRNPAPKKKAGWPFPTYETAPPKPDDLTEIKGVGAKLAAVLNDRGVYTFDQIAKFNAPAYVWLDETLGAFKGRGQRDDWAGQAKALIAARDK